MSDTDFLADLVDPPKAEAAQPTPETVQASPAVNADEAGRTTAPEWPKYIDDLPPGEVPQGCMTIPDFASHLTAMSVQRLVDGGAFLNEAVRDGIVKDARVYQAIKATRNPLPYVVVRNLVTTPDNESKVQERTYVPVAEATKSWFERPERGSATELTEDDLEKFVLRAGKAKAKLELTKKRHARVSEQLDKQTKLHDKYTTLLAERGKSWEEAVTAYDGWLETQEAGSEIADDGEED